MYTTSKSVLKSGGRFVADRQANETGTGSALELYFETGQNSDQEVFFFNSHPSFRRSYSQRILTAEIRFLATPRNPLCDSLPSSFAKCLYLSPFHDVTENHCYQSMRLVHTIRERDASNAQCYSR